jgi:hypothetical protein
MVNKLKVAKERSGKFSFRLITKGERHSPIELHVLPFSDAKQQSEKKTSRLSNK